VAAVSLHFGCPAALDYPPEVRSHPSPANTIARVSASARTHRNWSFCAELLTEQAQMQEARDPCVESARPLSEQIGRGISAYRASPLSRLQPTLVLYRRAPLPGVDRTLVRLLPLSSAGLISLPACSRVPPTRQRTTQPPMLGVVCPVTTRGRLQLTIKLSRVDSLRASASDCTDCFTSRPSTRLLTYSAVNPAGDT